LYDPILLITVTWCRVYKEYIHCEHTPFIKSSGKLCGIIQIHCTSICIR